MLPGNPYVVARNLAANREYDGPVVCTEPYFMNNHIVYQRLLAGDYDGTRDFDGKPYASIFREYADCVAQGLVKAYGRLDRHRRRQQRPPAPQRQVQQAEWTPSGQLVSVALTKMLRTSDL